MRAGKSVLNHCPCALRFSDARIELAKLGFREAGPWSAATTASCQERTDLTKCEPAILAESNQRHALGTRGSIVPSSSHAHGW
jgi:hypothetical protein